MEAVRSGTGPIITPEMGEVGRNVNGPSLIRAPEWVDDPLGTYYLYFGHHNGQYIRFAYADRIEGPWQIHPAGTLHLDDTLFDDHVASPDVHVDRENRRIRMYYHGCCGQYVEDGTELSQFTRCALSTDGVDFVSRSEKLGRFYFRVFQWKGDYYALAKKNAGRSQTKSGIRVYRSNDGLTEFEPGPTLRSDGARHTAVRVVDDALQVFYSRIGDSPERILLTEVSLDRPWTEWRASRPVDVLRPERDYEGSDRCLEPSRSGAASEPVRQLRDPALFTDDGTTYLLYTIAGERGIAVAELIE